jgi:arylsulfatase A-like enzyme
MRRMRVRAVCIAFVLLAGCGRRFEGPARLLVQADASGRAPRTATLSLAGDARPALIASATFKAALPRRPLLTFGLGVAWSGEGEAPGWLRFALKGNGKTLAEHTLNPRAAREWRDVSLPLEGLGKAADLEFALRFTDRDGKDVPQPPGLIVAAADPTVHDLDGYGRAKGIVLVSIDTLRRDHVGAYGYPRPTTPRLDALSREGVLCEDAVSTSSWTLPAHLSLLTGVDAGRHGGTDMEHGFDRKVPTLAGVLKQAGYATHAVTSHLYVSSVYGLDEGFDSLDFRQDRRGSEVAARAVSLIDRFGDRPFFLFLHLYDPHWHYDPPAPARALLVRPYQGTVTGLWQDFSRREPARLGPADLQHLLDLYDGEIRAADDAVGAVLDHLKARGADRDTLVVATSDHGEEFLEHGSWEHQKTLYEEVIRIPLVVKGPRVEARREPGQVSLLDVAPTVVDWAGLRWPAPLPGASLLESAGEREAFGETDHTVDRRPKLFLRGGMGKWKTIVTLEPDGSAVAQEEWYDLAADPGEKRSAPPRPERRDALRDATIRRWREARAGGATAPAVALTPEQRERLRALGYVGP